MLFDISKEQIEYLIECMDIAKHDEGYGYRDEHVYITFQECLKDNK